MKVNISLFEKLVQSGKRNIVTIFNYFNYIQDLKNKVWSNYLLFVNSIKMDIKDFNIRFQGIII